MAAGGDLTIEDGGQGNVKIHPYLITLVRWCVSCLWSTATVILHRLMMTPLQPIAGTKPSKPKLAKFSAGTEHLQPEPTVDCQILHQPDDHNMDVIFVHGLYGSLGNTWRQGDWRPKYKTAPQKVLLRNHSKPTCCKNSYKNLINNDNKCDDNDQMSLTQINEKLSKKIIPSENELITEQFYNNTLLDQVDNFETQGKFVSDLFKKQNCDSSCDGKVNIKCDNHNKNNFNKHNLNNHKLDEDNENICKNNKNTCHCYQDNEFICDADQNNENKCDLNYVNGNKCHYKDNNCDLNKNNDNTYEFVEYNENKCNLDQDNKHSEANNENDQYNDNKCDYPDHNPNKCDYPDDNSNKCDFNEVDETNECICVEKRCETGCGCICSECYSPCWPRDWIRVDFPGARVISINYTSDPYLWRPLWIKENKRLNLYQRAEQMIEQLLAMRVGDKPIIWVGHSKGGLFIKQIFCEAYEAHLKTHKKPDTEKNDRNDENKKNIPIKINNGITAENIDAIIGHFSRENKNIIKNTADNDNNGNKGNCYGQIGYHNGKNAYNDNYNRNNAENNECFMNESKPYENVFEINKNDKIQNGDNGIKCNLSEINEKTDDLHARGSLWRSSRGFMFYSVPHRGSPLADIKTPVTARSQDLMEIAKDCPLVVSLQQSWERAVSGSRARVASVVESCRTLMSVLWLRIVTVHSADAGVGTLCGVSVDHREICKPSSRSCLLYTELTDLIQEAMNCHCRYSN